MMAPPQGDPWQLPMGWCADESVFRLVAPGADFVELIFRDHPDGQVQQICPMTPEVVGPRQFWQWRGAPPLPCYRFKVHFAHKTVLVADPWAARVTRKKSIGDPAWSVALVNPPPFDWQGHLGVDLAPEDAVILELHVSDQSVHASARAEEPGCWDALLEHGAPGGLNHARRLGVNAIELLPVTSWPLDEGHGLNHWGYMPSFLCAVSGRYAAGYGAAPPGSWPEFSDGVFADPGDGLKRLVRSCHAAGVAVILDLVYNHVSMHDRNPLLLLDPGTWFHRDSSGGLRSLSGCGNDLNTADPEMRALILHSVRRWLTEFRVDGLRLDLAELIDDLTLAAIAQTAREVRPDVLLIAEPWSLAGHRPRAIATLGYAVWNDRCRHGIKGQGPRGSLGFAFGARSGRDGGWQGEMAAVLAGCAAAQGGHLPGPETSLNYVESHDDLSLGDFIRLALGEVGEDDAVRPADVACVAGRGLVVHRLVAALLMACRGPVMIAQGQCWGRAKVDAAQGPGHGRLCRNSYNRDDETNHLDWRQAETNANLVAWYSDLIAWRKGTLLPAWASGGGQRFIAGDHDRAIGYVVAGGAPTLAVLFNAAPERSAHFELPAGVWQCALGQARLDDAGGRVQATLGPADVAMLTVIG